MGSSSCGLKEGSIMLRGSDTMGQEAWPLSYLSAQPRSTDTWTFSNTLDIPLELRDFLNGFSHPVLLPTVHTKDSFLSCSFGACSPVLVVPFLHLTPLRRWQAWLGPTMPCTVPLGGISLSNFGSQSCPGPPIRKLFSCPIAGSTPAYRSLNH